MRIVRFILLILAALIMSGVAVLFTIDGNLSRIFGRTTFNPNERLFPYTPQEMDEVNWIRVTSGGEHAEFVRQPNGVWWAQYPWNDRMDPRAAAAILKFTCTTSVVDVLPLRTIDAASLKEFGVKTNPTHIVLKRDKRSWAESSTMARYTLGSKTPWVLPNPEQKIVNDTTYMQTDYFGRNSQIIVGSGNILPLFKAGIRQLRDHRPLLLHPDMPQQIDIRHKGQHITLQRQSPQSPWRITAPLQLPTDKEMVTVLLGTLQKLTAVRVHDRDTVALPDVPSEQITAITITNFATAQDSTPVPVTLRIYPADTQDSPQSLVKATVSDRNAIFEIPQHVEGQNEVAGTRNIPLELNMLRSKQICDISDCHITGISIRRGFDSEPIIARLIPGDPRSGVQPVWVYSADGAPYREVNAQHLLNLLKTVSQGKVAGFATDKPSDLSLYGLNDPRLTLTLGLQSKNGASHDPVTLFFAQGPDQVWYAKQHDTDTVVMLDDTFMRPVLAQSIAWKPKQLIPFNRFDLKTMSLERIGAGPPLVLQFDNFDDSWIATKGGKDETLNINPNRANRYLSELEKLQVASWITPGETNAEQALQRPVFRLQLVLNVPKTSSKSAPKQSAQNGGLTFLDDHETEEKIITLEIAPAGEPGYSRFYYGRISTSPDYFILDMPAVRLLGASLAEDN